MVTGDNFAWRRRWGRGVAAATCFVLAGCVSVKQFQKETAQPRADVEQVREHEDRESCIASGALPGSPDYLGCMLKHANARAETATPKP